MPHLPKTVDNSLTLPRIDEDGLRPMLLNLTGDSVGDDHVVRLANHCRRERNEALPAEDHRRVGPEARHVDAENNRRERVVLFGVVPSCRSAHVVNAD